VILAANHLPTVEGPQPHGAARRVDEILKRAARDRSLSGAAVKLLVYLAYWPENCPGRFPTVERAARDLDYSTAAIGRAGVLLDAAGYLAEPSVQARGKPCPRLQCQVTLPAPSLHRHRKERQLLLFADVDAPSQKRVGAFDDTRKNDRLPAQERVGVDPFSLPPHPPSMFEKTNKPDVPCLSVSSPPKEQENPITHDEEVREFARRASAVLEPVRVVVTEEMIRRALASWGPNLADAMMAMDFSIGKTEHYPKPVESWGLTLTIFNAEKIRGVDRRSVKPSPEPPARRPAPTVKNEPDPVVQLSADEIAALLERTRLRGPQGRNAQAEWNAAVKGGWIPAETFCPNDPAPAHEKPAVGHVGKNPPRPAGASVSPDTSVHVSSTEVSKTWDTEHQAARRQRARVDSNHQPSDSKAGDKTDKHVSAKTDHVLPEMPVILPEDGTTLGFLGRGSIPSATVPLDPEKPPPSPREP
jgi:hypothetical protein